MCIHRLAMVALLTATVLTGCDSAREVRNPAAQANAWGCNQCHGYPPPPFFPRGTDSTLPAEFPHVAVTGTMCWVCHPTTVLSDGHTIVAGGQHRDGQIEAAYGTASQALPEAADCGSCHGTPPATGQHLFHARNRGVACTTCHAGFDPESRTADATLHMQGQGFIVVAGGAHVAKEADADKNWPDSECASCHDALHINAD